MKLIRRSIYSGNMHEMDLPLTYAQIRRWQDGWSIDRAFPDLTFSGRGCLYTKWNASRRGSGDSNDGENF